MESSEEREGEGEKTRERVRCLRESSRIEGTEGERGETVREIPLESFLKVREKVRGWLSKVGENSV